MQRVVLNQLVRAGHICGTKIKGRFCVLEPGHDGDCTTDLRSFPASPVMRERARRAKAVVQHEAAERRVEALNARVRLLEARRAWAESYVGFRIEYRLRGGGRRIRRYYRFVRHRTLGRLRGTWPPEASAGA